MNAPEPMTRDNVKKKMSHFRSVQKDPSSKLNFSSSSTQHICKKSDIACQKKEDSKNRGAERIMGRLLMKYNKLQSQYI